MADPVSYASFMIRVWREAAAEPGEEEPIWVGEIESVQSGRVVPFRGLEALAKLLVGQLTDGADFLE